MKFTGDRPWQGARVKSSSPVLGKNGPDFPPLGGETPLLMSVLSVSALAGGSPAPKLSVRSLRRSRPCLNHKLYEVVCVGAVERDQASSFLEAIALVGQERKAALFHVKRLERGGGLRPTWFVVSGGCVVAGIPCHPSGPSPTLPLLKGCARKDAYELGF